MNLFSNLDYKIFIREQVNANRNRVGYKSRLAEAAGCQKSFFSKVMAGPTDLTAEHAAGLVQFWKLPETEAEYFIELVNHARAGTPALRTHIENRLNKIKLERDNLAQRFRDVAQISEEQAQVYYSGWQYLAIHYLISIPEYQTVEAIGQRLQCSDAVVKQVLNFLREMGVVENKGARWVMNGRSFHLPRASQFTQMNHANWRNRAVQNSFEKNARDIHYTSVGSISLEDVEAIRAIVLAFVDKNRAAMGASGTEELFCVTCDFFQV